VGNSKRPSVSGVSKTYGKSFGREAGSWVSPR
jgi:hypothetical protein